MKYILVLLVLALTASSCLKKVEGIDELNTNVYDPDYAGEQWFEIVNIFQFTNSLGQIRVRVTFQIPESNTPDLKPSTIDLGVRRGSGAWINDEFNLIGDGVYEGEIDFEKTDSDVYCLSLGIYVEEDNEIINDFMECVAL